MIRRNFIKNITVFFSGLAIFKSIPNIPIETDPKLVIRYVGDASLAQVDMTNKCLMFKPEFEIVYPSYDDIILEHDWPAWKKEMDKLDEIQNEM